MKYWLFNIARSHKINGTTSYGSVGIVMPAYLIAEETYVGESYHDDRMTLEKLQAASYHIPIGLGIAYHVDVSDNIVAEAFNKHIDDKIKSLEKDIFNLKFPLNDYYERLATAKKRNHTKVATEIENYINTSISKIDLIDRDIGNLRDQRME